MAEFLELVRLSETECRFEKREAMPLEGFLISSRLVTPDDRASSYCRFASLGSSNLHEGYRVFLKLEDGRGEVWGFNRTA